MSAGVGTQIKAAFRKLGEETSWPSGITTWPEPSPGAGHALPLLNESMAAVPSFEDYTSLYARAGKMSGAQTAWDIAGQILCQGMYNNLDRLICCAMGYECPNDPGATHHGSPESGDGKYTHIYELDDVLSEEDWAAAERKASGSGGGTWTADDDKVRNGTLALLKRSGSVWAYSPVMVNKMTISCSFGRITIQFDLVTNAYEQRDGYDSGTWTLASDETNLIMPDSSFYIGTTDGTTLTWQEIGVVNFELVLENNLEFAHDTKTGLYLLEPKRNAHRRIYGGIDIARYDNDNLITRLDDNDEMKAWLKFSTGYYKFNIYLPSFFFKTVDYTVKGPGVIKPAHTFECHIPSSDPFSADGDYLNIQLIKTNEFWILTKNDLSSNVLTEEA